jgi:Domain of unknown function (DUF4129)
MKKIFFYLLWACFYVVALPAYGQEVLPEDEIREAEGYPEPELSEEDKAELAVVPPPMPEPDYTPPPIDPIAMRPLDKKQWEDALDGIDYSKDRVAKETEDRSPSGPGFSGLDWTNSFKGLGTFLQWLVVVLASSAVIYGAFRLLKGPANKRIANDGTEITLDNLEDYLHESDLDRFLREALAAGNFNLAIRLYYLQVIKQLSEKKLIALSREKTNREYVRSLQNHHLGENFRDLTRYYERVWYGNQPLSQQDYADAALRFKSILRLI